MLTWGFLKKQPIFWVGIISLIILIACLIGVYFLGKSHGRNDARNEFDSKQAELLKKSQESDARAEKYRLEAEANEKQAEQLKANIAGDRKIAAINEQKIEEERINKQKEIDNQYENDIAKINSDVNSCDRCRDLCARSNKLAARGPEFSSAKCDEYKSCADACAQITEP